MEKLLFTSESVTEGHPDKICDADFRCNSGCTVGAGSNEPCRMRDMYNIQVLLWLWVRSPRKANVDIPEDCPRYSQRNRL